MPLGDSITQGSAEWGPTYRYHLWKKLTAAGFDVDFVGSQTAMYSGDYPLVDFDQDHEGHAGWRVDQVLANIATWATDHRPDIVLIHLGTNDLNEDQPVDDTVTELERVVEALRAARPRVSVLVAQILPCDPGRAIVCKPAKYDAYRQAVLKLAARLDRSDARVIAVDHYTFVDPERDLADGLHPNDAGDRKMAERWFEAIRSLLAPQRVQVFIPILSPRR